MMVRYLYKSIIFLKVKITDYYKKKTGKKIYFYKSFLLLFFNQYKNSNI